MKEEVVRLSPVDRATVSDKGESHLYDAILPAMPWFQAGIMAKMRS
jgi:hypothetical protein